MKRRRGWQLAREFWTFGALFAVGASFLTTSGHWIEAAIVFAILSESYAIDEQ